jgi:hypothetical protein
VSIQGYQIITWIWIVSVISSLDYSEKSLFTTVSFIENNIINVYSSGMQKYATIFLLIGFFVFGLPLAYILTFIVHMDIYGFWLGMIVGVGLIDVMLVVFVWHFDFDALSKTAHEHIRFDTSATFSQNSLPLDTSTSDQTTDERVQLLSFKYESENDRAALDTTTQTAGNRQEIKSDTLEPEERLFKLLRTKIIILFLFICLFIISVILSVR